MLTVGLIVIAILLLLPLVVKPALTLQRAGRMFAFLALVIAPTAAGFAGFDTHIERSKTVEFCTSCHVMEQFGKSLHIDDIGHLPATHYQFGRVPHETACFACHTNYTLYGDWKAKLRGLHHVYVQYLGTIPARPKLYEPYNNRECLHCHGESRSFLEGVTHKGEPGRMEAIRENRLSCLSKGCHETTHDIENVDKLGSWSGK